MKVTSSYIVVANDASLVADIQAIIKSVMKRPVAEASKLIHTATQATANKIKLWAVENLHNATHTGMNGSLYQRILNNPQQIAQQLATTMVTAEISRISQAPSDISVERKRKLKTVDDFPELDSVAL